MRAKKSGRNYGSGLALEDDRIVGPCSSCRMAGHQRKTHKSCPNKNNSNNKGKRKNTFGIDIGENHAGTITTEAEANQPNFNLFILEFVCVSPARAAAT